MSAVRLVFVLDRKIFIRHRKPGFKYKFFGKIDLINFGIVASKGVA